MKNIPAVILCFFLTVSGVHAAPTVVVGLPGGIVNTSILFPDGTAAAPSMSFSNDPDTGIFSPGADIFGLSAGGIEGYRITESGGLITHAFSGNVGVDTLTPEGRLDVSGTGDVALKVFGNDFVALAAESYRNSSSDKALINLYSSRGTKVSPLALLSGDLMGGIVFRGKKNTTAGIVEFGTSAKIEAVAEEDFTDTAQGTKLSFLTTAIGTSAAAERMRITNTGHIIQQELLVDPGTGDLAANFEVAIYNKNNKLVFAYNNGGTITYVSLALDGSATTWVHSTTAP